MKKSLIFTLTSLLALTACQTPTANTQTQNPAWDSTYGGADKSYDKKLLDLRNEIAPQFISLTFNDPVNGVALEYSLFIPKGYQPNDGIKYPLVMFIADASTAGKGRLAPLMQGYGGIIWASDKSQVTNPAFVLVPAFKQKAVDDNWNTTDEVASIPRLIDDLQKRYHIDDKRIYTTGQSIGGMISFYLNSQHPNLFAGSMFVGSQWDINVLTPLTQANFIYTVSAADPKASVGMKEVIELMNKNGVSISEGEFSARLPQHEQNAQAQAILSQGSTANFIRFSPNTVVPDGVTHKGGEHMYSFDYAYLLDPAREWLLSQTKDKK